MNILFKVNDKLLEVPPDANQVYCLHKLIEIYFTEWMNSSEREIAVIAQIGKHKLQIHLEKHPVRVDNGMITMRDYVLQRLSNLILSIYRTRELETENINFKDLVLESNKMYTEISLREDDLKDEIDKLQKKNSLMKQTLITIGNLTRMKDNITLQEINRHVDDALESLE